MSVQRVVLLMFAAGSSLAFSQAVSPFLGKWNVTWEGERQQKTARLVISESGGSWKTMGFSKKNPCLSREAPISIESSSASKLVLTVKLSEAYAGCSDSKVVLKMADDGTITGKHGRSELALVRQ